MGHVLIGCVYPASENRRDSKQTEVIDVFYCLQCLREKKRHVPLLLGREC